MGGNSSKNKANGESRLPPTRPDTRQSANQTNPQLGTQKTSIQSQQRLGTQKADNQPRPRSGTRETENQPRPRLGTRDTDNQTQPRSGTRETDNQPRPCSDTRETDNQLRPRSGSNQPQPRSGTRETDNQPRQRSGSYQPQPGPRTQQTGSVCSTTPRTKTVQSQRQASRPAQLDDLKHYVFAKPGPVKRPHKFKETIIPRSKSNALLVAAIDFGTTYTGFGYSFKADKEHIFGNWHGSEKQVQEKIPTVVLMNPEKEFHSFGVEANKKYIDLMKDNKHHNWYYFDRFKMKLFVKDEPLRKDMEIEDILGKPMRAMEVFTAAIEYIRDHMLSILTATDRQDVPINGITDIHWVLTIPAIWDDLSKQFMREAAQNAGIPSDMLTLALEPEAASLYCQRTLQLTAADSRYILIDLGGGTVDITCHEVSSDGTLTELHPPTGGDFGGMTVDNAFISVLNKIFGADVVKQFKTDYTELYWDLLLNFDLKKRLYDGSGKAVLQFPFTMLQLYEDLVGESVEDSLKQSTMAQTVTFRYRKMFLQDTLMGDMFSSAETRLIKATEELLAAVKDIQNIILVGGFSESPFIQKAMLEHFGNILILPKDRSLAVLKGAILYGHDPTAISSRTCRYTYGIARMVKFDPRIHPDNKKVKDGRFTFCDDIFCKHIEIGAKVKVSGPQQATAHEYFPSSAHQRHATLEVYSSCKKNPMFVDEEGSHFVGLINVDIDSGGDIWTKLMVRLLFGGTELIVEVTDVKKGTVTKGSVDFLG